MDDSRSPLPPFQAMTQLVRACLSKMDMHRAVISWGSWEGHQGCQGWTVHGGEMRGPLTPRESSCCSMSTPLNHGPKASPVQGPECNLAQHQKQKLSAVASPAKEIPEALIFMFSIFNKEA